MICFLCHCQASREPAVLGQLDLISMFEIFCDIQIIHCMTEVMWRLFYFQFILPSRLEPFDISITATGPPDLASSKGLSEVWFSLLARSNQLRTAILVFILLSGFWSISCPVIFLLFHYLFYAFRKILVVVHLNFIRDFRVISGTCLKYLVHHY